MKRLTVGAGLVDAALASIATLGATAYAARSVDLSDFGTYALFFSAFMFAAVVPAQLTLVPAAHQTVFATPGLNRLSLLDQTWRLGALPGLVAAAVACIGAAWAADAPSRVVVPLAVTTAACSVISPIQDHVRRVLHMSGLPWQAAMTSGVQLIVAAAALGGAAVVDVPQLWRPLGSLALANAVSTTFGLALARSRAAWPGPPTFDWRDLIRSGRWLVSYQVALAGSWFATSAIVTWQAGPDDLGRAEAARLIGQPITVLMMALTSVFWPSLAEAASNGDEPSARRTARSYQAVLLAGGLLYGAVTSVAWSWNPLADFLPAAYEVTGLVALTVMANIALGVFAPTGSELVGGGREPVLAAVGAGTAVLQCGVAVPAAWLGARTRPLAALVMGLASCLAIRRCRRSVYGEAGPAGQEPDADVSPALSQVSRQ